MEDKTHLQNRTQKGKRNETVNNPSSEERLVVKLEYPEKAQYITIPLSDSWRPLSIHINDCEYMKIIYVNCG